MHCVYTSLHRLVSGKGEEEEGGVWCECVDRELWLVRKENEVMCEWWWRRRREEGERERA